MFQHAVAGVRDGWGRPRLGRALVLLWACAGLSATAPPGAAAQDPPAGSAQTDGAGTAGGAARAAAGARNVDAALRWSAPDACPTLDAVRPIFDAVVPDELREALAETQVSVVIEERGGGYQATIRVARAGYEGERVVEGSSCAEVARSAIIVVSVALADAQEATAAGSEADAAPGSGVLTTDAGTGPQTSRWAFDVGARVVSGLGDAPLVPQLALSALFVGHAWLALGLQLGATPYAPLRHAGERVARAATVTLAPMLCALPAVSERVRVGACAALQVGASLSRGLGLETNLHRARVYSAVSLAPTLVVGRREPGRGTLRCGVEAELRITQPDFVVAGLGQVGRFRSVGFGGTCGVLFFAR
ncbi:MAG: hypothetical protein H6725_19335 [Sandaracinaceae bacterium]|nr:hypothetical protein [Sandaracinaceae bacterium]